jgi:hypothetical protein
VRAAVRKLMLDIHAVYVAEIWSAYLDPCCVGCKTGMADCDVNPVAVIPSRGDLALTLLQMGECP